MKQSDSFTPEEKRAFVEAANTENIEFLARKTTPAALARMQKFRASQAAQVAATEGVGKHDENLPLGSTTGAAAGEDRRADSDT